MAEPDAIYSELRRKLIERRYRDMGCDKWSSRLVLMLCAKVGDTPECMAARLRIPPAQFQKKLEENRWTRQEGLIFTTLEREIDFLRANHPPEKSLFRK